MQSLVENIKYLQNYPTFFFSISVVNSDVLKWDISPYFGWWPPEKIVDLSSGRDDLGSQELILKSIKFASNVSNLLQAEIRPWSKVF